MANTGDDRSAMEILHDDDNFFLETGHFYTVSGDESRSDEDTKLTDVKDVQISIQALTHKISKRKQPPPERTFKYFVDRGLLGSGKTVNQVRSERIVTEEDCVKCFGAPLSRKKFRLSDCRDSKMWARILKIWPVIYSKQTMPQKLTLEFTMAVVAEEQKGCEINWANFAVAKQGERRAKYKFAIVSLARKRAKLEQEGGLKNGVEDCDSKLNLSSTTLGASVATTMAPISVSDAWIKKLHMEVSEMAKLVSVEWLASRHQVERTSAEKLSLADKTRAEKGCLEAMRASLEGHMRKCEEQGLAAMIDVQASALTPNMDGAGQSIVLASDNEPLPVVEQRPSPAAMHLQWCTELVSIHKANWRDLSLQLEVATSALNDLERRRAFHESCHNLLTEQLLALSQRRLGVQLQPHPLPYPVGPANHDTYNLCVQQCKMCLLGFHFNDIIVCSCQHLYHPFCAALHFKENNKCANPLCGQVVSPEWAKSFGFREFDAELLEKEISEGCEGARIEYLNHRRDAALKFCPNVGSSLQEGIDQYSFGTNTCSIGESSHLRSSTALLGSTSVPALGKTRWAPPIPKAELFNSATKKKNGKEPCFDPITLDDDEEPTPRTLDFIPGRVKVEGDGLGLQDDHLLLSSDSLGVLPAAKGLVRITPPVSEGSEDDAFQESPRLKLRRSSRDKSTKSAKATESASSMGKAVHVAASGSSKGNGSQKASTDRRNLRSATNIQLVHDLEKKKPESNSPSNAQEKKKARADSVKDQLQNIIGTGRLITMHLQSLAKENNALRGTTMFFIKPCFDSKNVGASELAAATISKLREDATINGAEVVDEVCQSLTHAIYYRSTFTNLKYHAIMDRFSQHWNVLKETRVLHVRKNIENVMK